MKPIKFKECNVVFAKDQPEYNQLPAYKAVSDTGEVVTCWKLSFIDRIKILFTGKMWLSVMTFNRPLSPVVLSTNSLI